MRILPETSRPFHESPPGRFDFTTGGGSAEWRLVDAGTTPTPSTSTPGSVSALGSQTKLSWHSISTRKKHTLLLNFQTLLREASNYVYVALSY